MNRLEGSQRATNAAVAVSLFCGALVLVATRADPLLSPDSITYLAAADHVRSGAGLTDFTGEPLTVFGPVYPLLLTPGGRSLLWASIIGALAVATATFLMFLLLRLRVRPWVAFAGAAAYGASQGLVRVASTVWSEAPYAAVALGTLLVLVSAPARGAPLTTRRAAVGGLLAGVGFLTRYAGAGLVLTGLVVVLAASWSRDGRDLWRRVAAYCGAAAITSAVWAVRNLILTGEPLGPRFEGGTSDSWEILLRLPRTAIGLLLFSDLGSDAAERIGTVVVAVVVIFAGWVVARRPRHIGDLGIAAFAVTSLVIPVVARMVTSNDIEFRVMSPMLIPVVYIAVVAFNGVIDLLDASDASDAWSGARLMATGVGSALVALWAFQGVAQARDFPDWLPVSAGSRTQHSRELYDIVDALPPEVTVLTNNPQRVWWQTGHEPTLFAFTRPRPGNSHYPLNAEATLEQACSGDTYLAWFGQLQNAGDSPQERRPDLLEVVDLTIERSVPGGQLYVVSPYNQDLCNG